MSIKYRRDIDGLRAIAVLPVILFHSGFKLFEGGYTGVDVFFVISGYLITSIILKSLDDNTFSLKDFYLRRVKRLMPALTVVMVACVIIAPQLLPALDLKNFFESLFFVPLFSSNFLFWYESGYFDTASELKPLLHTWSLAVEEQYYLIFPPLMLFAYKKWSKNQIFKFLTGFMILSFAASCYSSRHNPTANFYLHPWRTWEIALGAFLAFLPVKAYTLKRSNSMGLLGLALILVGIFAFDADTPFPGFYALFPTIGTALILFFYNEKSITAKLLGNKLLVGIGMISYSTYLWHQPLIAFYHAYKMLSFTVFEKSMLVFSSLLLGYISWRFVEQPIRFSKRISIPSLVRFAVVSSVIFIAVGGYGSLTTKPVEKVTFPFYEKEVPVKYGGHEENKKSCPFPPIDEYVCNTSGQKKNKSVVIVGDSHARVLTESFYGDNSGYSNFYDLSGGGCPFLLDLQIYHNHHTTRCTPEYQNKRLSYFRKLRKEIKNNLTIVTTARLPLYLYGDGFDNEMGGVEKREPYYASTEPRLPLAQRETLFFNSLEKSVTEMSLNADKLIIILPGHTNGWDVISRAIKLEKRVKTPSELKELLVIDKNVAQKRRSKVTDFLYEMQKKYPNIVFIDPMDITCSGTENKCYGFDHMEFLFTDTDHLSYYVNNILKNKVFEIIN